MSEGKVYRPATAPNELGCWMVSLLFILIIGVATYFLSARPVGEAISLVGVLAIGGFYVKSKLQSRNDEIRIDGEAIHQILWGKPRSLRWANVIAYGWLEDPDREGETFAGLMDRAGKYISLNGYLGRHELLDEIEKRSGLTFQEEAPPE
jgi:hypothetical protein